MADFIISERTLLAAPGEKPTKIRQEITVTNGTGAVSVGIHTIRTGPSGVAHDAGREHIIIEDLEAVHLLADALIRKAVNVRRGVHDNSDGAI
jgi:hypothetical protein